MRGNPLPAPEHTPQYGEGPAVPPLPSPFQRTHPVSGSGPSHIPSQRRLGPPAHPSPHSPKDSSEYCISWHEHTERNRRDSPVTHYRRDPDPSPKFGHATASPGKTRRVYADGLHQLSQSHQLTAPSGHLPQFSFLQEIDKLTNNHLQPLRLTCKYLNRGLHPGDVAVMIRSPDIDEMIISSRKLVLMVGNVRREISWSLVAANQNPV